MPLIVGVEAFPAAAEKGLKNACEKSAGRNCKHLTSDIVVGPGETRTWNGPRTVSGNVTVTNGGKVVVEDASVAFEDASYGFVVQSGGTLEIRRSHFFPTGPPASAKYGIDVAPTATFVLNDTRITNGTGIRLASSNALVSGNVVEGIAGTSLRLNDVTVDINHNHFIDNTVAVNQTGGFPTLRANVFEGGIFCVRDWLSDPTIIGNVFTGCHTGIWHERSESTLKDNLMDDRSDPGGVGIAVIDTMSPIIEGNVITNYGIGIKIQNARAYIRNNSITGNVAEGVRVQSNSAPMDITGNFIASNGGDGISLASASDIIVSGNNISGNVGSGISIISSNGLTVDQNVVVGNSGSGVLMLFASFVDMTNNVFASNDIEGANLQSVWDITSRGDAYNGNHNGFFVHGGTRVLLEDVTSTANAQAGVRMHNSVDVLLTRVNASANDQNGFVFFAFDGHMSDFTLDSPRAIGNAQHGLFNANGLGGANATIITTNGWWQGNGSGGVRNDDGDVTTDATCSYWGSVSGPTHGGNPNGTGDAVIGDVDYSPYRASPSGTVAGCPVV